MAQVAGLAFGGVKLVPDFAKLLYTLYSALERMRAENDTIQGIYKRIRDIQNLLEKYTSRCDSSVAEQMEKVVNEHYKRLEWYVIKCQIIQKEGNFKRFRHALTGSTSDMLQKLGVLLDRVYLDMNSHSSLAIFTKMDQILKRSQNAAIYSARSDLCQLEVGKVDKPHVYMKGPQLYVKVNDSRNNPEDSDEYEIVINKKWFYCLKREKKSGKLFDIAIIEPERMDPPLQPGEPYSFQVRVKNAKGLGEWSDSTTICLDTGILGKPDKPVIVSEPGTGIVGVNVEIPKTYTNHVTKVVCQYFPFPYDKENGSEWISENFLIPESENRDNNVHTFSLTECSPCVRYHLRIIFINKFGESEPSDTVEVPPAVPGAPTEVRRSSNYTSSMIKLRWKPPELGQEFVDHYLIKYKRYKDEAERDFSTIEVRKTEKDNFSARVKHLKSNTMYIFFISGVNASGASGPAASVEAETKWPKQVKLGLSPFVFLGTTVGVTAAFLSAPVTLPVCLAVIEGVEGVKESKSKPGAVARGVVGVVKGAALGGIGAVIWVVGAPVIGPFFGVFVTLDFVNGLESLSDQSDEED